MPLTDIQGLSDRGKKGKTVVGRHPEMDYAGNAAWNPKTGRAPTPLENAAQFLLIDPVKDSAVLFLGNEGNVGNVAKTAQDPMDIYKKRGVYGS